MASKNLRNVFEDTIWDIYDSEQQFLESMPKLAQSVQNLRLKEAIASHALESQEHVRRIEWIASKLGFDPAGVVCQPTLGLVREAKEHVGEFGGSAARDAAIVACAQKNEHFEIANYGTVITWAEQLGLDDEIIDVLEKTLDDEEKADDALSQIAEEEINPAAGHKISLR